MAVYVDEPIWTLRRMKMCHMIADTFDELHRMADSIGVDRRWFQSGASFPHYDVCKSKREAAIHLGARAVDRRELVAAMRRIRQATQIARGKDGWTLLGHLAVRTVSIRSALRIAAAVSSHRKSTSGGVEDGIEWMLLSNWRAKYE